MAGKNIEIMENFTVGSIPNLDVCVLAALELFSSVKVPKINIPFKRPLLLLLGRLYLEIKMLFLQMRVLLIVS